LKSETLFISDLHLALDKPDISRRFLSFLQKRASKAQRLYILGDLFDTWVGDDDYTPPTRQIRSQLRQLTNTGVRVYLQPGNRDFLLGERFSRETGVVLLADYECMDLYGVRTLLTHGDLLCSDDTAYQQFRIISRSPEWRRKVLSKPLWLRLLAARWYRFRSHFHKRGKSAQIMDVNPDTVAETLRRFDARRLIHGHTHRPAVHKLEVQGEMAERFVLAQWTRKNAAVLCWSDEGYHIETLE